MLSQFSWKKNAEGGGQKLEVNGVDVSEIVQAVTITAKAPSPFSDVVLYLKSEVDLNIEGTVYLVASPKQSDVFKQAAAFVRQMDPKNLEDIALAKMEFGGAQDLATNLIDTIVGVLEDAATESQVSEEVRGSTNGGSHSGSSQPGDSG